MRVKRTDSRERSAPPRRGSVLVFTVLLLVLLAGIGTAFVMFVNLEYAASGNALRSTQSRAAAETGLVHARHAIRESLLQYRFETPDGFFDLAGTTRPYLDEATGLFRFFEYHPGITTVAGANSALTSGVWPGRKDFAWLYWNSDTANCGVAVLDGAATGTPHTTREMTDYTYSEFPLAHASYPNGQVRTDRDNGIEHAGLARRFEIRSPVTEFYTADPSKSVSPYRGEYYIWIADLDAKLYAPHSGVTWGMTNASDVNAILQRLRSYGYSSGWGFDDASGTYKLGLTDAEITALAGRTGRYASIDEVAAFLKRTPPASGSSGVWDHLYYRYGLERYLTCWQDDGNAVKVNETALNVNTASYEVLTSALSRIPLVDTGVGTTENLAKASYLAKRICAKRPFVCRIDFEDFLAAHLNASPGAIENPEDGTVSPVPPARMVYLAIPKRQYQDAKTLTDLTLAEMMETPVEETDTRYQWLKNPLAQQSRFLWFRADEIAAPLYTDATNNALLSVKAFNNVLNSISGQIPGGGFGYSFYSYDGVAAPFMVNVSGTPTAPKFVYNELTQDVINGGTDIYTVEALDPSIHTEGGELAAWRATNTSGYYAMTFSNSDDHQHYEYAKDSTGHTAGEVVVLISGNAALETPCDPSDTPIGTDITETADGAGTVHCDSTIHGPLRAYRHDLDPVVTDADPAVNAGDISWSPRFCFRSRFYKVYVLARSIVTLKGDQEPVYGPTSRLEAVYDAYEDKVLWRRWQSTELRRLSDPVP